MVCKDIGTVDYFSHSYFITDNPGFCPSVDPRVCRDGHEDECFDDASCDAGKKCCHDGCKKNCIRPLSKPMRGPPRPAVPRK